MDAPCYPLHLPLKTLPSTCLRLLRRQYADTPKPVLKSLDCQSDVSDRGYNSLYENQFKKHEEFEVLKISGSSSQKMILGLDRFKLYLKTESPQKQQGLFMGVLSCLFCMEPQPTGRFQTLILNLGRVSRVSIERVIISYRSRETSTEQLELQTRDHNIREYLVKKMEYLMSFNNC